MAWQLRAHLSGLALAGLLLLSLAGPVMAQAIPEDEVASIDDPSGPGDTSGLDDSTAVLDDAVVLDDGEINPEIYYSMGADGCMVCRGGDAGAEEAATEAASSAADRAVDQFTPSTSDPAP